MDSNDEQLLSRLVALRNSAGWSQDKIGHVLGASQGHLSKILSQKVPISLRMAAKIRILLTSSRTDKLSDPKLENDLIIAMRDSSPFRSLISAALEMHNYAKTPKRKSR
jgi:transcriptional regulator with XRE-family HTH domain